MLKKTAISCFIVSALSVQSSAQHFNAEKLDSLFDNLERNNKAMGSLLISKNGSTVYNKSIGYSLINDSEQRKIADRTKYRIGSITKTFTAVLVFQLVEEGKLSLNTPLSTFFKTLPNADKITIGHMLSHRSGLFNYTNSWDTWRFSHKSQQEILAIIGSQKPEFEPDAKTAYSNSNYMILGFIIEKITGKSYAKLLREKIVFPLGLKDTYYGGKVNPDASEAFSYNFKQGKWRQQPETDMNAGGAAGAIVSTPHDLVRFMDALFGLKLISQSSLTQMLTIKEGEGMGMQKLPFYNETLYGHSGQIDYFQSYLLYFPEHKVAIAYMSNGFGGATILEILSGVLHIYFNKPYRR